MQIRTVLSGAIALGLLAAIPAQAALVAPSNPTTGSSMFVTVFDRTNNESFTTDLGLFYASFIDNTVTPGTIKPVAYTPFSLDLNMAIFADNNPDNIRFNVYAGDAAGSNGQKGFVLTSNGIPSVSNNQMNNINVQASAEVIKFNTNCPGATAGTGCAGTSGAENIWGSTIFGQFTAGSVAGFDEALAFYLLTGAPTPSASGVTTVTKFADGFNWMLTETGRLTFSGAPAPIPLPAAVWLLISGLAGLGALGRRSSQKG